MKRTIPIIGLVCVGLLLMAAVGAAGSHIFKVRSDQTGANTKIADFQNGAGASKMSIDIEGDLAVAGAITAGGVVSQSGTQLAVPSILVPDGGVTVSAGDIVATAGNIYAGGTVAGPRYVVTASSGSTNVVAAKSGGLFANTGTSGTTTFVLPAAAAGLWYCFVEAGDAAGELLVNVQTGDLIIGKTHGAQDGSGIATAAGTGIKNTAATNVKGDFACLTAVDATNWVMTSVAGVWASQ